MRISDWSSDVCSSDLRIEGQSHGPPLDIPPIGGEHTICSGSCEVILALRLLRFAGFPSARRKGYAEVPAMRRGSKGADAGSTRWLGKTMATWVPWPKIGRASCRERVCQYV